MDELANAKIYLDFAKRKGMGRSQVTRSETIEWYLVPCLLV